MSQLEDEIKANHAQFFDSWNAIHSKNVESLRKHSAYVESYKRLSVMQAIKVHIVQPTYTPKSAAFFFEAHNDALVSHVAASSGAWRSALQSLRSCIENTLAAVYYSEHPVELELWEVGKFRIGFSDLMKYMEKHPKLAKVDRALSGLQSIADEYATLSKAVHSSAENFRMTDSASKVLLWSDDPQKASQWSSREKKCTIGIITFLLSKHHELIQGARLVPLRDVASLVLTKKQKSAFKAIGVNMS